MNIRAFLILCAVFIVAFFIGLVVYMKFSSEDVIDTSSKDGNIPNTQSTGITCRSNGNWSQPFFHCEPPLTWENRNVSKVIFKCPSNNESICETQLFFPGDVVSPECNVSYVPDVTPSYRDSKCQQNGTWDSRIFQCVPVTCESPYLTNINFTCQNSTCDSKYNPGDVIKPICSDGYQPNVNLELVYSSDYWYRSQSFECVQVTCENLNLNNTIVTCPNNNSSECMSEFLPGDAVLPKCIDGFIPQVRRPYEVMTCQDDGTWDRLPPLCIPDRRCFYNGIFYEYGDVVNYADESYICICIDTEIQCY